MRTILSTIILAASLIIGATSCSREFDIPPIPTAETHEFTGQVTHTIAELKSQFAGDLDSIGYYVAIKGIVCGTDESGNIYKKIMIMDASGAIEISIDQNSLYTKYPVGQEVVVECQGLFIGKYGGVQQLGYKYKNATSGAYQIGRMPVELADKHIYRNGTPTNVVTPEVVEIANLNLSMVDKPVTFENIRFTNADGTTTFSTKGSTYPVSQEIKDAKGNKIIAYTSAYADFALDALPKGNGSISGILSYYNGTWQLLIRDRKDIGKFDGTDGGTTTIPTYNGTATHSIAQFKSLFTTDLQEITDNIVLRGIVTSSDESGNVYKKIYIQDESGAIELNINATSLYKKYKIGQEVFVECKGLYTGKYGGVLQIGEVYNGKIGQMAETSANSHIFLNKAPGTPVSPLEVDIPNLKPEMIGKLVTLKGLTFANGGKNNYVSNSANTPEQLKDAQGNAIILYTNKYASFANTQLPEGTINITAILSQFNGTWQLILISTNDVTKQ